MGGRANSTHLDETHFVILEARGAQHTRKICARVDAYAARIMVRRVNGRVAMHHFERQCSIVVKKAAPYPKEVSVRLSLDSARRIDACVRKAVIAYDNIAL